MSLELGADPADTASALIIFSYAIFYMIELKFNTSVTIQLPSILFITEYPRNL